METVVEQGTMTLMQYGALGAIVVFLFLGITVVVHAVYKRLFHPDNGLITRWVDAQCEAMKTVSAVQASLSEGVDENTRYNRGISSALWHLSSALDCLPTEKQNEVKKYVDMAKKALHNTE